jgi:phospholipid-binding lipoprotein MlaA
MRSRRGLLRSGIRCLCSLTLVLLIATASGALTAVAADLDEPSVKAYDPLEPMNRAFYHFNKDFFDKYILIPLVKFHNRAIPRPARISIRNFFENLREPVTVGNDLLQMHPGLAGDSAARFGINTTIGIVGLRDVADGWGLHRSQEDFGQTLGSYGVGQGPYLVLPVLGSSSVRDLSGRIADEFMDPLHYVTFQNKTYWMIGKDGLTLVESRAHKTKEALRNNQPTSRSYEEERSRYTEHAQNEAYNRPDEDEGNETMSGAAPGPMASLTAPGGATAPITPSQADAINAMKDELEEINLQVSHMQIEGSKLTLQLKLKSGAGPLPCDKIWHGVHFDALPGIDTVTAIDPSGDARYNCTKFMSPAPLPPVESGPPSTGPPTPLPGT